MSDIVQVIADVLASVDDDVYRGRLADRGTTWEATSAQYNADMAQLHALRDLIVEDRKARLSVWSSEQTSARHALLAFCREVGP